MDWQLLILLLLVYILQNVAGDTDNLPQGSTSSKFLQGPNDEWCILSDRHIEDRRYEQLDEYGSCCCSLCNAGQYAKKLCECGGPDTNPRELTDCDVVPQGTYMDKANKCSQPYPCTSSCGDHQRKVMNCTARSDIICECLDGWYNPFPSEGGTIPRECRRRPLCPASQGQECQSNAETEEVLCTCQPCKEGFFHPFKDSTASCQPHRVCLVKRGSAEADSVCINDDLLANLSSNVTQDANCPAWPIPVTCILCMLIVALLIILIGYYVYVKKHNTSVYNVAPVN